MSDEIKANVGLSFLKEIEAGYPVKGQYHFNFAADFDGQSWIQAEQTIATSETELTKPTEVGNIGLVVIVNSWMNGAGNVLFVGFADVAVADDARPIMLRRGEACLFRFNKYGVQGASGIYARADGGYAYVTKFFIEE
jgi:hypothetical protein